MSRYFNLNILVYISKKQEYFPTEPQHYYDFQKNIQ